MIDLELLLNPDEDYSTPEARAAMAAALRKQHDYGTLGQLMGVEPTVAAGQSLQAQSQGSLKLALQKQQAAKEAAARKAERDQAQQNWQAEQQERRRQFDAQEDRLWTTSEDEANKQWQHAVDPITGQMRLYNQITGEWQDGVGGSSPQPRPAGPPGFAPPPEYGYGKQTEAEQKSQFYAQTMTQALPEMVNALSGGYRPARIDQFAAGPQASGFGGEVQRNVPRSWGSEQGRRFYTAGRQVLAGILRKESGAAITDDEWQNYGPMYLPWPGDSDAEIERKMQVLYSQAESAARGSGSAYRYWTAPRYLPTQEAQGGAPAGSGEAAPRAGDRYLEGAQ